MRFKHNRKEPKFEGTKGIRNNKSSGVWKNTCFCDNFIDTLTAYHFNSKALHLNRPIGIFFGSIQLNIKNIRLLDGWGKKQIDKL